MCFIRDSRHYDSFTCPAPAGHEGSFSRYALNHHSCTPGVTLKVNRNIGAAPYTKLRRRIERQRLKNRGCIVAFLTPYNICPCFSPTNWCDISNLVITMRTRLSNLIIYIYIYSYVYICMHFLLPLLDISFTFWYSNLGKLARFHNVRIIGRVNITKLSFVIQFYLIVILSWTINYWTIN